MFKNYSTHKKLLVSFSIIVICIVIIVLVSITSLFATQVTERNAQASIELMQVTRDVDSAQTSMMATLDGRKDTAGNLPDLASQIRQKTSLLIAEEKNSQQFQDLDRLADQYIDGIKKFSQLIESNQIDQAQKLSMGPEFDRAKKIRELCSPLAKELAKPNINQSEIIYLISFVGACSVVFAIFCYRALCDEIAKPLQELKKVSERLAAGDLSINLPDSNRQDEVGLVLRAYVSMVESLRTFSDAAQRVAQGDLRVEVKPRSSEDTLGQAFALMVENMSTATSQITSAVEVLSTAVNNIMASVSDSASGATQTATAVTETTTTVEEVRQTSHVANQKAKNVAESAQKSAHISNAGRKSTEETIVGMKRIREQMDLIADSMVRLSEKSQSIVEIIATVDDLAQQSNLLAVNASIEAAKAGELGRGFAVVAQEVKSMSDQSKQATAQVRKILGEIQQATTSAAMATELGSRAVDSAVTQSNQAGEAISTLANSVVESANAAAQIAVSSQQQLAGVDQVATAMLGIKDATAQNLLAIKRVEEATLTLQELGGTLKVLTKRYQL